MTIESFPFTSEFEGFDEQGNPVYDHAVSGEFFRSFWKKYFTNGVFIDPSDNLKVEAGNGLEIVIKQGGGHTEGLTFIANSDETKQLNPQITGNRTDIIVTCSDFDNKKTTIEVRENWQPSDTLMQNASIWEMGLSKVVVRQGASLIEETDITDLRPDPNWCGFVSEPLGRPSKSAKEITFDDSKSHLSVENTQDAIDEIAKISKENSDQISNMQGEIDGTESNISTLQRDILRIKMRQTGLVLDPNAWSDTLEDENGINKGLSNGYYFDTINKSLKASAGIDAYTKLMIHMNGTDGAITFIDSSLTPKSVTPNGNVKISTTQNKFGGSSGYFDGSGDFLTIPNSMDFDFGSNDFTIDLQIYPLYAGSTKNIITKRNNYQTDQAFSLNTASASGGLLFAGGNNNVLLITTSFVPPQNQWTHVAVVRNSNIVTIYANGIAVGSKEFIGNFHTSSANLYVGRAPDATAEDFYGYMNECRVSKGIARWTSNFTPPSVAYGLGLGTVFWNSVLSDSTLKKAVIEAIQNLGTDTIQYYISRDNGTTFTQCTLDAITDISAQPTGTNIVLKAVINGNAELQAVAWGGQV